MAPQEETAWNRWWLPALAGLLVLLAVAAFLWLRRRGATRPEEDVPAEAEPATPSASAPATLTPIRQTPAKAAPRPALVTGPLEFRLEPQTLRLSFVYATLSYQLDLTNREEAGFTALRIAGDLISGHASLPTWQQLSLDGQELEHKHDVLALAPGETVTLKGELRRPLAEILPLRAGTALLFAPLARFRVEATGGGAFADTRIFTIGQPSERAGGAMQPFRLDLGPQLFRQIDLREVDVARWLPLDETRRAS